MGILQFAEAQYLLQIDTNIAVNINFGENIDNTIIFVRRIWFIFGVSAQDMPYCN